MSVTVLQRRRGDLPVDVTSFVGRRRELAEIRSLLSSCRLVTVSGAGGVGKTRLAVKAAHELRRAFPDGVWMVELADLNDPGLVAHTVATAIGLRLDSSRRPVDQLCEHLADKQALILLDNCEHLVDACAVLVDALLRARTRLRVLASSRQSLGIAGECTMAVTPLSVPGTDAVDGAGDALTSYDSVRLLQDRVGAVLPGFAVTHENSGTVAQLCQRLEGIPLAIEMATVRLRALSLEQVLDRLDDQFWLLASGDRAAQPRQQTLRALMDWSYDLLTQQERLLWARTSVFVGGFEQGLTLARQFGDPLVLAYAGFSGGMGALYAGDLSAAIDRFEQGLAAASQVPDVSWRLDILLPLAPAYGGTGAPEKEIACHEEILSITEPRGERFHRSYSLWALGVNAWQQGDLRRAQALEAESLRLKRELDDRLGTVFCMEAFAWIAASEGRAERAAQLLGAAATLWESMGSSPTTAGHLAAFHESCVQETRQALGETAYEAAYQQGMSVPSEDAVAFALEEQQPAAPAEPSAQAPSAGPASPLTRREQQIAELIAEGLSNKDIASRLVIAQRTAEGHVERILVKLGFSSRSQVAAWVAERRAAGASGG